MTCVICTSGSSLLWFYSPSFYVRYLHKQGLEIRVAQPWSFGLFYLGSFFAITAFESFRLKASSIFKVPQLHFDYQILLKVYGARGSASSCVVHEAFA